MNTLATDKKLNIAVVGYGKMGTLIASVAAQRGHSVVCTVDPQGDATHRSLSLVLDGAAPANTTDSNHITLPDAIDVCIDFSTPDSFKDNVTAYGQLHKPVVVGTTGWNAQQGDILSQLTQQGVPILYGSNFSVGVQLFIRLAAEASRLFSDFTGYDFAIVEQHHNQKLDNPSGTALSIAEAVVANHATINEVVTDPNIVPNQPHQLHVAGVRVGSVPGTHSVYIDSRADTITLQHNARSREGFALGAVLGAEWLVGKTGCFAVSDFIDAIKQS